MRIERLDANGVRRFRAVRLRALADAPDAFGTTHRDAVGWSPKRWSALFGTMTVLVAVEGDADVGMIRVSLESERTARLGSLWVDPDARGLGVGRALVEAVTDWARSHGRSELVLDVGDHNTAAIALYARFGFQPDGRVARFPEPREHLGKHTRTKRLADLS